MRFTRSVRENPSRLVAIAAIVFAASGIVYAFQEPSSGPPSGGSVTPPVNTGSTAQTKSGSFTSSGTITANILNTTSIICFPGDCRSAWPSGGGGGGGGTVTQLNQGGGISLSANPITTTGTISLATQNCSGGQFVTAIGGTITCATPPSGGSSQWTTSGSNIYYSSGNAGVVSSPSFLPAGSGNSFSASGNLYSSADGGSVVGIGELGRAVSDYPGALVFGCGWDAGSNTSGCITGNTSEFRIMRSTGASNPLSQVRLGRLMSATTGNIEPQIQLLPDEGLARGRILIGGPGVGASLTLSTCAGCWAGLASASQGDLVIRTESPFGQILFGIGQDSQNTRVIINRGGVSIVNGSKNFLIDHPLDPLNKRLVHSSLEGPEVGVYYRGKAQLENGTTKVTLPSYFEALTRKEDRTVLLTNIDGGDVLWIETQDGTQIKSGIFVVRSANPNSTQQFNWEVKAVRSDIAPLQVEVAK